MLRNKSLKKLNRPPKLDLTKLKQEIKQLENDEVKGILHKFLSKLIAEDEIILQLQNGILEVESSFRKQKYSPKDCLIIEKTPVEDN